MHFLPDCCEYLTEIAATGLAAYVLAKVFLNTWNFFNVYFLGSAPQFSKYGAWSVVTGATDGIGLSFAKQLAKAGQNVVLISRSPDKLKNVSELIEKEYGVSTKVIAVDFSSGDIYEKIASELSGLDIGTLVNNVGLGFPHPEYFHELAELSTFGPKMVSVNVVSVVRMTELVLPGMVAKKKGIVLNVSSASALQPTPLLSLYAASKQFVDCFSKSLSAEYSSKGIIVQCVMPYFVSTKMSKIRKSSLFVPTPDSYVRNTMKTIGRTNRTYGCPAHALQAGVYGLIPESLYFSVCLRNLGLIRKKALKKLAKSN